MLEMDPDAGFKVGEAGDQLGNRKDRTKMFSALVDAIARQKESISSGINLMDRRFQRPNANTRCVLIREDSHYKDFNAAKYKESVVSWCMPDPQNPLAETCALEFCFVVKEVQDFILEHTKGKADVECPMFGLAQMKQALGDSSAIQITPTMPHEFRHVFEEYHLLSLANESLKDDIVMRAVKESVEAYLTKRQNEKPKADPAAPTGTFWNLTKTFLAQAWDKTSVLAVRIVKFLMSSPWWLSVILRLAQTVRIVICVTTSLADVPGLILQVLDIMKTQLKEELGNAYEAVGMVIDAAKSLYGCLTLSVSNCGTLVVKTFQLFKTLMQIIRNYGSYILSLIGLPWFRACAPSFLTKTSDVFQGVLALDQQSTQYWHLANTITQFTPANYSLLGVILFLDTMLFLLKGSEPFVKFVLDLFPKSQGKENGGEVLVYMSNRVKVLSEKRAMSFIRLFVDAMAVFENVRLVLSFAFEIYQWITDVIPCLFSSFLNVMKYMMTLGFSGASTDFAACCMKDLIMSLRKQLALGEEARLKQQDALNAREVAKRQHEVRQKELSERKAADDKQRSIEKEEFDKLPLKERLQSYGTWILGHGPEEPVRQMDNADSAQPENPAAKYETKEYLDTWKTMSDELGYDLSTETFQGAAKTPTVNLQVAPTPPTVQVAPTPATAKLQVAATHTMSAIPTTKRASLWVAQCSEATTKRKSSLPIFIYDSKVPFYLHEKSVDDGTDNPWCVAPDSESVEREFPEAVWTVGDTKFVLLHHVPKPFIRNMFHLETPIFNLE